MAPKPNYDQPLMTNPMIDDILRESSVVSEWVEEGMQQGMRATILRVLEGRFGPVDAALTAAIQTADDTALSELALHAGTSSLDELRARLGLS